MPSCDYEKFIKKKRETNLYANFDYALPLEFDEKLVLLVSGVDN